MISSGSGVTAWFCLGLFLVVATFGAFMGGLWAILGIGGAIVLYGSTAFAQRSLPKPAADLTLCVILALAVMAGLNTLSMDPHVSWSMTLRLASIFLPLLLLTCPAIASSCCHPALIKTVTIAAIIGAIALGIELENGAPLLKALKGQRAALTEYNRGLSYLVLLAFPLMAGILSHFSPAFDRRQQWLVFAALGVVLLFSAGLTESRAAKLALIMGLAVVLVAHFVPILARRGLIILPFLLLGWPFMAQGFFRTHYQWLTHLPDSWRARIEIWDYISYRIAERPWLGWGLGTSHLLPFHDPDGARYVFTVIPAAHPHNVIAELWVELGVPGLVLGLCFALVTLKKALAVCPAHRPFALGAWMAGLCLSLVAYDFWTDSLFAAFALTGFMFALLDRYCLSMQTGNCINS